MPQPLSGPGVGLPFPQFTYPSQLFGSDVDIGTNVVALAPGEALPLAAGNWYITGGTYLIHQFLNPLTNSWTVGSTAAWGGGNRYIKSDGFTARVANMLGCPIGAVVTGFGAGYTQAGTTITPSVGNSTWSPIIGGALTLSTINAPGGGYGIAPLVIIPAPPGPVSNSNSVGGIAATAYATLSNGSVNGITFLNQGAGYPSLPTATIVPNPTDPNINSGITAATITLALEGSGQLTGAICTNPGAALTNAQVNTGLTLTVAGTNTSPATLSAIVLQTVVGLASIYAGGQAYSTSSTQAGVMLTTVGGAPNTSSAFSSPDKQLLAWRPRVANIALAVASGSISSVSAIYDGGMFEAAPTPVIVGGAPTVAASVLLTMGSVPDYAVIQPAP